jgi:hypothetical protein
LLVGKVAIIHLLLRLVAEEDVRKVLLQLLLDK